MIFGNGDCIGSRTAHIAAGCGSGRRYIGSGRRSGAESPLRGRGRVVPAVVPGAENFPSCGRGLASSIGSPQIEKDIPQPQVVAAFGLLITNRDPCRSSL